MRDGGLRQLFQTHLPQAHWQSIETWSTGSGVPDGNYCFPGGREGWVEYKVTSGNTVAIRPAQIAWAERRIRAGGRIWLAVRKKRLPGPLRIAQDTIFLYRGGDMRAVLQNGLHAPPIASWEGGPSAWDWDKIRGLLCY